MAVTSATPWDTTPAEAPSSTHGKQQRTSTAPSDGVMNAFAATLAAMLAPALPLDTTTPDAEATSELDAPTGATANGTVGATADGTSIATDAHGRDATSPGDEVRGASAAAVAAAAGAPADGAKTPTNAGAPVTSTPVDPRPAYAAAADARSIANSAPVTDVNTDSDALNPEFRTRLNRVVKRMHDELGHDVELVEGYRPQTRQDYLYAQGRTRNGPVVTWTRSSKHSLGLAADLKIDGSYGNPGAYQQLARIAAQEGLRTLGSRDPGHVELPNRGGAAAWGAGAGATNIDANVSRALELALTNDGTSDTSSDQQGSQSNTDGINGLLSRATRGSAAPAPGATPYGGSSSGFGSGSGSGFGRGAGNGFGAQNGGTQNGQGGVGAARAPQHDTRADAAAPAQPNQPAGVAQVASVANVAPVAQVAQVAQVATPGSSAHDSAHQGAQASSDATPMTGALSAARVGHLLDVRDATPAQPLSHVTLDLDNASGGSDRITVQLRSGAVDTSIALGDSSRADKMSLRVGELQHALEQHGLETGAIQVAQTGTDTSAGWNPRQGGDQRGADQRPTPNYRDHRQDADDARQRSRREQQGRQQ